MVLGSGLSLAALGIVVGIGGALGARRLISALLVGIAPTDPRVFAIAASVLLVTALLGCLIPARRAIAVSPMEVLSDD